MAIRELIAKLMRVLMPAPKGVQKRGSEKNQ
jgi:hypothetical protein